MQEISSGFYGPFGNPINKGISHFGLGPSQIPNRNPSQNFGLKEESLVYKSKINKYNHIIP